MPARRTGTFGRSLTFALTLALALPLSLTFTLRSTFADAPAPAPTPATADSAADPGAPTVGASLDRDEAHVGDRLTLTVSAVARAGVAVTLPEKLDLGKLEVLDRAPPEVHDLGNGRQSHRFVLGVTAYEPGDLEVPAITLSYVTVSGDLRSVATAPVPLHIRSLLASGEHATLQKLRPPRAALVEDGRVVLAAKWGGIVLGSALALLLIVGLGRRALRRRAKLVALTEAPTRPPDEVAMEKLRALRFAGNFEVDGYRPFYFAVAEVVRAYLGARYGFDSLELTTTELMDELRVHAAHLIDAGEVARFLGATDLVKFAKAGSTDEEARAALDAAQAIVLSTAAPLEEVVAEASGRTRVSVEEPRENSGG